MCICYHYILIAFKLWLCIFRVTNCSPSYSSILSQLTFTLERLALLWIVFHVSAHFHFHLLSFISLQRLAETRNWTKWLFKKFVFYFILRMWVYNCSEQEIKNNKTNKVYVEFRKKDYMWFGRHYDKVFERCNCLLCDV